MPVALLPLLIGGCGALMSLHSAIVQGDALSGSVAEFSYRSTALPRNDFRSRRSFSAFGALEFKFTDHFDTNVNASLNKSLDDDRALEWSDISIAFDKIRPIFVLKNGNVGFTAAFRLPLSERSKSDDLRAAVYMALPVRFKCLSWSCVASPWLEKNFHQYSTAGGRVLPEWLYGVRTSAQRRWHKNRLSADLYVGRVVSYAGTVRSELSIGWQLGIGRTINSVVSGYMNVSNSVISKNTQASVAEMDFFRREQLFLSIGATVQLR